MARAPVRRMVSIAMAAVSGPSSDTKSRKPSPNQRDLHRRRADLSCDSALTFPGAMEESASPDDRMLGIGCGAQGCEEVRGTRQRVSPKPQVLVWLETNGESSGSSQSPEHRTAPLHLTRRAGGLEVGVPEVDGRGANRRSIGLGGL